MERETKAMWGNVYQASDTTRIHLDSAAAHMDKDYESVDDARDEATRAAEKLHQASMSLRDMLNAAGVDTDSLPLSAFHYPETGKMIREGKLQKTG